MKQKLKIGSVGPVNIQRPEVTPNLHNINVLMFGNNKLKHKVDILLLEQRWPKSDMFIFQWNFIRKNKREIVL